VLDRLLWDWSEVATRAWEIFEWRRRIGYAETTVGIADANGCFLSFFLVVRATHTQEVLGEQGRRIRELTSLIQKRFKFPENSVSLYAAKVQNRGLSAVAQCESLRYKLLNGLAVRRACYGVLRFIMESGAKGCEVVVSGKLRAARAKSMKFTVCLHRGWVS